MGRRQKELPNILHAEGHCCFLRRHAHRRREPGMLLRARRPARPRTVPGGGIDSMSRCFRQHFVMWRQQVTSDPPAVASNLSLETWRVDFAVSVSLWRLACWKVGEDFYANQYHSAVGRTIGSGVGAMIAADPRLGECACQRQRKGIVPAKWLALREARSNARASRLRSGPSWWPCAT
jgi:hypothetical protein